jgi:hypothetical protein
MHPGSSRPGRDEPFPRVDPYCRPAIAARRCCLLPVASTARKISAACVVSPAGVSEFGICFFGFMKPPDE